MNCYNIYLDSNQSERKSFGAQVSFSESSNMSVIHESASRDKISMTSTPHEPQSKTSVVQETLMTSQHESVAQKSLQVSMTSSDESEKDSVTSSESSNVKSSIKTSDESEKDSVTSSESSNVKSSIKTSDESEKDSVASSKSSAIKVLRTSSDDGTSPESNGNEKVTKKTDIFSLYAPLKMNS